MEADRNTPGAAIRDSVAALNSQAIELYRTGAYDRAYSTAEQARDRAARQLSPTDPEFARALATLASTSRALGRYDEAESLYREAILANIGALGPDHPNVATCLNNLAVFYDSLCRYADSESLHEWALSIRRKALDAAHPDLAQSLANLASLYCDTGRAPAAEPLCRQALEIYSKAFGNDHPDVAASTAQLAQILSATGRPSEAEAHYRQAIESYRSACGSDHPRLAPLIGALANLYADTGRYLAAEPLYRQSLDIRRRILGETHPEFIGALSDFATYHLDLGQLSAAEPLLQQVVDTYAETIGRDTIKYARALNNLAALKSKAGRGRDAEELFLTSLAIQERLQASDPSLTVSTHANLAATCETQRRYGDALTHYHAALECGRRNGLESDTSMISCLLSIGDLHLRIGDLERAEQQFQRAVQIAKARAGEKHPKLADALEGVARVRFVMGQYKDWFLGLAEAHHIQRDILPPDHPDLAHSIVHIANAFMLLNDYENSLIWFSDALEVMRRIWGEDDPRIAETLDGLGRLYQQMGDLAKAEPLHRRAVEMHRKLASPNPASLIHLSILCANTGRVDEAMSLMTAAMEADDKTIGEIFSFASESQRSLFLESIRHHFDVYLSLMYRSETAAGFGPCFDAVLRRKAIEAEALATQRDTIMADNNPDLSQKLHDLASLRVQIANKVLSGAGPEGESGHRQLLSEWKSNRDRLETELARAIPEMNLDRKLRASDRRAVALGLPSNVVLVEFVRFQLSDLTHGPVLHSDKEVGRYLAFVLTAGSPDESQIYDLGDADEIDRLIGDFRSGIIDASKPQAGRDLGAAPADHTRPGNAGVGQTLRAAVFDRFVPALAGRKRLLLAPDGDLTRLPFEVLPTPDGGRLIDEYVISYVSCGRDVLRFGGAPRRRAAKPVIVADPDFDLGAEVPLTARGPAKTPGGSPSRPSRAGVWFWWRGRSGATRSADPERSQETPSTLAGPPTPLLSFRKSRDLDRSSLHFDRLPGTRIEGDRIAAMLGVEPWLDVIALEGRLKTCRSPRILHLATHGFFLANEPPNRGKELRNLEIARITEPGDLSRLQGTGRENPLLRSGLALAGANTWLKGANPAAEAEDGLLTAEDVSGLNLLDTELVVLSACETGLGEIHVGEGVFGLRRAFMLAGAKTLVMSLWKVPDQQTQELMVDFYSRILAGQGRADALREAQLALKARQPDPLYWGAFICQGDPAPLPGQPETAS